MNIPPDDIQDVWELSKSLRKALYERTEDIDTNITLAAMCNALIWCIEDHCEDSRGVIRCREAILSMLDKVIFHFIVDHEIASRTACRNRFYPDRQDDQMDNSCS